MAFNLTAGNPRAHRIRVYYTESSTIYEGMPVCYEFDATTNWFGGSVNQQVSSGTAGEITATTTTAEGSQNEGKYIRVEDPDADNTHAFAGVVAKGGWVGKTGPRALDIYVPNGAIVPVRANIACTVGKTILSVINAVQYLGQPLSGSYAHPVALAAETVDRSSTAGIVLATLDPTMFIYQEGDGAALIAAATGTSDIVVNKINVTSAQTGGRFTALHIESTATGNFNSSGYGHTLYCQTNLGAAVTESQNAGVSIWTNITAGTHTFNQYYALEVGLYEGGANLASVGQVIAPLALKWQMDGTNAAPANTKYMMYFRSESGGTDPDGLFACYTSEAIKMTAKSSAAVTHIIPIRLQSAGTLNAGTYYIMVSNVA